MTTFEVWLLITTAVALAAGFVFSGYHVVFVFLFSAIVAGILWVVRWMIGRYAQR